MYSLFLSSFFFLCLRDVNALFGVSNKVKNISVSDSQMLVKVVHNWLTKDIQVFIMTLIFYTAAVLQFFNSLKMNSKTETKFQYFFFNTNISLVLPII